jgi:large subunit ribosomal protein L23Ae
VFLLSSTDTKTSKASAAARAVANGTSKRSSKIRTTPTFYRPRTLRLARAPKYARRSMASRCKLDQFRIVREPLSTEQALQKIEDNNTLVFLVDIRSNKYQIKQAVRRLYDIGVDRVNTLIRPDGKKKAYVRLTKDQDALDVASRLGIL